MHRSEITIVGLGSEKEHIGLSLIVDDTDYHSTVPILLGIKYWKFK